MDPLEDVVSPGVVSATPFGGFEEELFAEELIGTGQALPGIGSTATSAGVLSETWEDTHLVVLASSAVLASSTTQQTTSYPELYNLAHGGERVFMGIGSTLTSTAALAEAVSEEAQFLLVSRGVLQGIPTLTVDARGTLYVTGLLSDEATDSKVALLSSAGAASDSPFIGALVARTVSASGALTGTTTEVTQREEVLTASVTLSAALLPTVDAIALLEDEVDGVADITASGNSAWTASADSWAATRYAPYDFASLTAWAGKLYAAGPQGLVELTGATDGGTPISAWARSHLTDFGDKRLKLPRALYVGYQAEQPLTVKMTATDSGVETEYEYSAPARLAETFVPDRVRLGRGIRSRYVRYTLMNESGGDFSIDSAFVDADLSDRRV